MPTRVLPPSAARACSDSHWLMATTPRGPSRTAHSTRKRSKARAERGHVAGVAAQRVEVGRVAVAQPLQRGRRRRGAAVVEPLQRRRRPPARNWASSSAARPWRMCSAARPMPESAPKRKLRDSQTTVSRSAPGSAGAAGTMASARQAAQRGQRVDACRAERRVGAELGEHRTRLHRRQLVLVAQQHQPRAVGHGLQQPRGQRQVQHRGLVDHQHVDGQRLRRIVTEAAGVGTQQPVHGGGLAPAAARAGPAAGAPHAGAAPRSCAPPPCRWARPARCAHPAAAPAGRPAG